MSDTRIAAYQLVDYLDQLGVDVVFGLTGHTVIAFLDALGRSKKIRYVSTRHEQVAAHAADGYARASGTGSIDDTPWPGSHKCGYWRGKCSTELIPMVVIAGDVPSYYFGRHPHQEVNLHMDGDQYEIYRPFVNVFTV